MKDRYFISREFHPATMDFRELVEGLRGDMLELLESEGANPVHYDTLLTDHSRDPANPKLEVSLVATKRSWIQ